MKQQEIVKAFLYSPINIKEFPCFCGSTLKLEGYGGSPGQGNGTAICENGHAMILAHQFTEKKNLPRYYDKVIVSIDVFRFENEICKYCCNIIGEKTEWQREVDGNAVHTTCHYNKIFSIISKLRSQNKSWDEIHKELETQKLAWSTPHQTSLLYKRLLEEKITRN